MVPLGEGARSGKGQGLGNAKGVGTWRRCGFESIVDVLASGLGIFLSAMLARTRAFESFDSIWLTALLADRCDQAVLLIDA